tara:strand:- start:97 stop:891 length:795 start_codon:yes stop_codon:yes gene_type:complete
MEQVIGKIPINAFHVTGPNYLKTMKDILGKKKSISTFTKANKSSGLAKGRGVQTDSGGVIFHVEGLLLARKYMDFDSVPDRTGRRWVQSHHIFDGDHMILKSAMKKAKMPDYDEWREIERKIERKVEDDPKNQELRFSEQMKLVKKELGPIVAKQISKYIDITNKLMKKHKEMIKKSITQPSKKTSPWWNEILIYNVKVKDCFVLKRVWDDYYFQHDSGYDRPVEAHKKELFKFVDENKVTIGTPAQFRKWYKEREGEITISDD